ncbi:uncharacterized protein B0I36DRAFT_377759 [Microdochium trichocladiopsis]|uniref:Uncharacterized protein n=1 Tax=Microdochium trichocladiopsis TaxID=1682393 RepID=A0A9P8XSN6_9PEZI|nr:uncharacterized protein B0I36DRAFT_377759 [Microdochium trichocladiopsis]KAH7016021.1 hypothetical protein B0I36DRAFT_377759 [Microdochium trichocladiopsis]
MRYPDWREKVMTLTYDNRGDVEAFVKYCKERRGAKITTKSTLERYLIQLWAVHKKYTNLTIDSRLPTHMLEYIAHVTRRKHHLRTEPKVKNHIGPDAHIYLSHFRWVRDWKNVFKIGLDRLDDATLRHFQMFTGARPHEFAHARIANDDAIKKEYNDELDAFTDTDEEGDFVPPRGPCWKVLCWEDIKLWIIRDPFEDGGRDRLVMTVLFRFHKGHEKEQRPTTFIFIEEDLPLLCPVSHLLAKALAEGVVAHDGYSRAEPFFRTKLSVPGVQIRWKQEFMHTPVFRQTIKCPEGYTKSDQPLRKDQLDNNTRNLGRAAGLIDNLTNYDYRRGNLEAIDCKALQAAGNCRSTVRRQVARHKDDGTFQDFYNNSRTNVVTQDAFLGRGTRSPYLAIFNQLGLQIDEEAPTTVTDEMMRFIGPGTKVSRLDEKVATLRTSLEQKYGRASLATGQDKTEYEGLLQQRRTAAQKHKRKVVVSCRRRCHLQTARTETCCRASRRLGHRHARRRVSPAEDRRHRRLGGFGLEGRGQRIAARAG